ncbi:MAG: SAM-dependent methyltransferase [Desulfosarcinaceae bacterium]
MRPGKASWTAQITAIYRAVESLRAADQRICDDPYARGFLDPPFRLILKSRLLTRFALWLGVERRFPGGVDTILSRIRHVDDCLAAELERGAGQVVLLGAGFDARALRFASQLAGRPVFEVDHPATQAVKMRRVKRLCGRLPRHVAYVGVDFEKQSFLDRLWSMAGTPACRPSSSGRGWPST